MAENYPAVSWYQADTGEKTATTTRKKKKNHYVDLTLASPRHVNNVSAPLNWSMCLFQWGEAADRPNNWADRLRPLLRFHTSQPRKMLQSDCRTSTNGSLASSVWPDKQFAISLISFIGSVQWEASIRDKFIRGVELHPRHPPPPPLQQPSCCRLVSKGDQLFISQTGSNWDQVVTDVSIILSCSAVADSPGMM